MTVHIQTIPYEPGIIHDISLDLYKTILECPLPSKDVTQWNIAIILIQKLLKLNNIDLLTNKITRKSISIKTSKHYLPHQSQDYDYLVIHLNIQNLVTDQIKHFIFYITLDTF